MDDSTLRAIKANDAIYGTQDGQAVRFSASDVANGARSTIGPQFIPCAPSGSGGGGTGSTAYLKQEAEAPFSRFRIWVRAQESAQSDGFICAGAVTEEPAVATVNNVCVPRVGGVDYNNIRSSAGANQYGFQQAAFIGGGVMPASVAPADDASRRVPSMIVSDWIQAQSVPPTSGLRPFALARVAKTTGSAGTTTFPNNTLNQAWANAKANGEAFGRVFHQLSVSGNGIGTPGTLPGSVTQSAGEFWMGIEFDYTVPVKSVLAMGDSIIANGGYNLYGWDNFVLRAALAASTPDKPIGIYSTGLSGYKLGTSVQHTLNLLAAGHRPNVIVLENFSINNVVTLNNTNAYHTAQCRAGVMEVVDQARKIGAQVILMTSYHWRGASGGAQAAIIAQNDWARALASAGVVTLFDIDAGWRDSTMLGVDGTHPNPVGIAYAQSVLQPLLLN